MNRQSTLTISSSALLFVLVACAGADGGTDDVPANQQPGVGQPGVGQPVAGSTLGMPAGPTGMMPGAMTEDPANPAPVPAEEMPMMGEPMVGEPMTSEEPQMEEPMMEEPAPEEPMEEPAPQMPEQPAPEPMMEEPEMEPEMMEEPMDEEMDPSLVNAGDVPEIEYCADVAYWDPTWAQWEEEVLLLVNENRAAGADCGERGSFEPADALSMDPLLRCVARAHSLDMFERGFFDHTSPDGADPGDRLDAADYMGGTWGENIAQGYSDPQQVVDGWMDSDGHCSNIMSDNFSLIGVGYHPGETGERFSRNSNYWTQVFGAPPRMGGGGFGGGF